VDPTDLQPGRCDQPWTFAEVDHRTPWALTHRIPLDDLDRVCRHDTG
jgi:hypothetical protein